MRYRFIRISRVLGDVDQIEPEVCLVSRTTVANFDVVICPSTNISTVVISVGYPINTPREEAITDKSELKGTKTKNFMALGWALHRLTRIKTIPMQM